jgi:hypothetical protein
MLPILPTTLLNVAELLKNVVAVDHEDNILATPAGESRMHL